MGADSTVVFADLSGSTRVFEAMGNVRATQTVMQIIRSISSDCEAHGGRVVKTLGDGLFAIFSDSSNAIAAVIALQRGHGVRVDPWPIPLRMQLQIGVARGEVVELAGDCYGDAVNLASRLSDLAGPGQIWASEAVMATLAAGEVRHRNLGAIAIRGKNEMPVIYRLEWHEDMSQFLTIPATLGPQEVAPDSAFGQIELSWLDVRGLFSPGELPIHVGRVDEAQFLVNDPRVSRLHARIELRHGSCVLIDTSTYGTWVRFHGHDGVSTEIALRRKECVLHGSGEIGLGAPLGDFGSPSIAFKTSGGSGSSRW